MSLQVFKGQVFGNFYHSFLVPYGRRAAQAETEADRDTWRQRVIDFSTNRFNHSITFAFDRTVGTRHWVAKQNVS